MPRLSTGSDEMRSRRRARAVGKATTVARMQSLTAAGLHAIARVRLLFHGRGSETGVDREPADARNASAAGVVGTSADTPPALWGAGLLVVAQGGRLPRDCALEALRRSLLV